MVSKCIFLYGVRVEGVDNFAAEVGQPEIDSDFDDVIRNGLNCGRTDPK